MKNNMIQPNTKPQGEMQPSGFMAEGEKYIETVYQKITPADKGAVERAVAAGGKVMFSAETHKYMTQILDGEGDIPTKLGYGITQLMVILFKQSGGNLPMNVWAPAGSILLVRAMEFVDKTDGGMSMEIFSEALKTMLAGMKIKVNEIISKNQPNGQATEQPQAAQPSTPAPTAPGLMGAQPGV